jgi:hypothetical protein
MAALVSVVIVSAVPQAGAPSTQVAFEVSNDTDSTIWVVDDGLLIWRQTGKELELSYARGKLQPGSHVFGYFPPSVVKVESGANISREVHLIWPQPLDPLWNSQRNANPPPGEYQISVRIGYGLTPEPDPPSGDDGVETPVFRWQKEAISQPVLIKVPPYGQGSNKAE